MEIKKELKVADFISLSIIYNAINTSLFVIGDGLDGEYAEEIKKDLMEIYELVTSTVTLKDGAEPDDWEKICISECLISMSFETVKQLSDKIFAFNKKAKDNYHLYDDIGKIIIQNLNEPNIEYALENLMYSLFGL